MVHFRSLFEFRLVQALTFFRSLLHVLLAVALVVASGMVVWQFASEVVASVHTGAVAKGFLHAMGTLFIVWILSGLIGAEIDYVGSGRVQLRVFIEVAMIVLLRQLIIEPLQVAGGAHDPAREFDLLHYGLVLAAILVVGITHRLVREAPSAAAEPVRAPSPTFPRAANG